MPVPSAHIEAFRREFGRAPEIAARAPGRVNLIGEHTDYNGGFVFPCAIDHEIYVLAARAEGPSRFISREMGASTFRIEERDAHQPSGWARYGVGMADVLDVTIDLDVYVASEVPIGSGVSSSAAMEMAFGLVYAEFAGKPLSAPELAKAGQRCENAFVGVNCGIMDQMASACAKAGHAMFLDTRSLEIHHAPLPSGTAVIVLDTKKPRALTDSAYNERRSQCELASRILGVPELRDADLDDLLAKRAELDPVVFRRARHVISENDRAQAYLAALPRGDMAAVGRLMAQSHASLRDDYEVSCRELDAMVEAATSAPGLIGVRMTGAGFGGCCVALAETDLAEAFIAHTLAGYAESVGRTGDAWTCRAVDGASLLDLE